MARRPHRAATRAYVATDQEIAEFTAARKSVVNWFVSARALSANPPLEDLFRGSILKGTPVFKGSLRAEHKRGIGGGSQSVERLSGARPVYSAGRKSEEARRRRASRDRVVPERKHERPATANLTVDRHQVGSRSPRERRVIRLWLARYGGAPDCDQYEWQSAPAGSSTRSSAVAGHHGVDLPRRDRLSGGDHGGMWTPRCHGPARGHDHKWTRIHPGVARLPGERRLQADSSHQARRSREIPSVIPLGRTMGSGRS
jgi:hypothetical protein